ncbi:hypothetical protein [Nocardiopsis coralliicola]
MVDERPPHPSASPRPTADPAAGGSAGTGSGAGGTPDCSGAGAGGAAAPGAGEAAGQPAAPAGGAAGTGAPEASPRRPGPLAAAPGGAALPVRELRIHGVSGGQAEELLDVEPAVRVGGDGLSGFFRWRRRSDTEVVPGVHREIFAWGNLTSGRASRALWLLLLPFMLVNIAYWMRPGVPGDLAGAGPLHRSADRVYGSAVRLLAVSLTALLALAAAGIGMDLVAWQCAGYGMRCAELRPLLGMVAAPGGWLADPGPALLVGALLPVAVLALLWRLSRRTSAVYDARARGADPSPSAEAPLSDPDFWRNSTVLGRLRSAHIAVAVAAVALLMAVPPLLYDAADAAGNVPAGGVLTGDILTRIPPSGTPLSAGDLTPAAVAGLVLAAASAAVLVLGAVLVLVPATADRWNRSADAACTQLRNAALALFAATSLYLLVPREDWEQAGRLPGYAVALNGLFALQCVLVLVMAAAAAVLYLRSGARGSCALRGQAGPAATALGLLLGGVFTAAVVYQVAGLLGGCYYPGAEDNGCIVLHVPGAFSWLQLAFTMEAAIALCAAAALALSVHRRTRRALPSVARAYGRPQHARRTRDIARARALGAMTETLPACLAALMLPAAALALLVGAALWTGRLTADPVGSAGLPDGPAAFTSGAAQAVQDAVTFGVNAGSWLGGLLLAALVWVGASAYRNRPMRQGLGVLWDIGTFWPRAAHPLAPPSYAERAVPQLVARTAAVADSGAGVVLSGHSQGSVLAAAAVWQLPGRCRPRVALVTHGSPLSRLYSRYFPAHFGPVALADIERRVASWRNLWRSTDAIGGPVYQASLTGAAAPGTGTGGTVQAAAPATAPAAVSGATAAGLRLVPPEEPLPDPRRYGPAAGEALEPEVLGHSFYVQDPAYADAVRHAVDAVLPGTGPAGTAEEGGPPAGYQGP